MYYFFSGRGIDIGCDRDPITPDAITHDKIYGFDASDLSRYPNECFDFVYSSHCLEHLVDPTLAVKEWWRVVKKGGHLIIVVPHFALYEKKVLPSRFNSDHKWGFTLKELSKNIFSGKLIQDFQLMRLQTNDTGFNYNDKRVDQTTRGAQAEIEVILKKVRDTFWSDV